MSLCEEDRRAFEGLRDALKSLQGKIGDVFRDAALPTPEQIHEGTALMSEHPALAPVLADFVQELKKNRQLGGRDRLAADAIVRRANEVPADPTGAEAEGERQRRGPDHTPRAEGTTLQSELDSFRAWFKAAARRDPLADSLTEHVAAMALARAGARSELLTPPPVNRTAPEALPLPADVMAPPAPPAGVAPVPGPLAPTHHAAPPPGQAMAPPGPAQPEPSDGSPPSGPPGPLQPFDPGNNWMAAHKAYWARFFQQPLSQPGTPGGPADGASAGAAPLPPGTPGPPGPFAAAGITPPAPANPPGPAGAVAGGAAPGGAGAQPPAGNPPASPPPPSPSPDGPPAPPGPFAAAGAGAWAARHRGASAMAGAALTAGAAALGPEAELALEFAKVGSDLIVEMRRLTEQQNASNRQFAGLNPKIAMAFSMLNYGDMLRNARMGRELQDSAVGLAQHTNRMRESWVGFDTFKQRVQNEAAGFSAGAMTALGNAASLGAALPNAVLNRIDPKINTGNILGEEFGYAVLNLIPGLGNAARLKGAWDKAHPALIDSAWNTLIQAGAGKPLLPPRPRR